MRRAGRFLLVLLAGLAALAAVGYFALTRTTHAWFERDLALRTQLAVLSARQSLEANWTSDRQRLTATLTDITRDERIMAAAACSLSGVELAKTANYPAEFSCRSVLDRMRLEADADATSWSMTPDLPSGRIELSVTMLTEEEPRLGAVVLVHDLSFLTRREATTRNLLLVAFFVLSLGASLVTVLAARLAWRDWTLDLRRALTGGGTQEFQPLVRDVRSLVERLASERDREARGGPWSPERLRATLTQHLQGERVVVLANREPYIHEKGRRRHPRGPPGERPGHGARAGACAPAPASGSPTAAAAPIARRSTRRTTCACRPARSRTCCGGCGCTEEEEHGYYYGFSNEGLWPLCHVAHTRPRLPRRRTGSTT